MRWWPWKRAHGGEVQPVRMPADTTWYVGTRYVLLPRRDTTDNLTNTNPHLRPHEPILDYTRGVIRIGPGHWNDLTDYTGSPTDPLHPSTTPTPTHPQRSP